MQGYFILIGAAVLFSVQFIFNDIYEKNTGNTLSASMIFTMLYSFVGFLVMLFLNRFQLDFSWAAAGMAIVMAIDMILLAICSLKALNEINISLYSLFMMVGGMVVPFIYGIFIGESIGLGKILCLVLVTFSMTIGLKNVGGNHSKKSIFYYIATFLLNGLSGVIAAIYTGFPSELKVKTETDFSALSALAAIVIAGIVYLCLKQKKIRLCSRSVAAASMFGAITQIANLLLLTALAPPYNTPSSAQFPLITGGVMIFSTLFCFFTKNKPSKREIIAVLFALAGVMCLFFIPESLLAFSL